MNMLRHTIDVPVGPERAFAAFTGDLHRWWPTEYTWSGQQALVEIGMEAGAGGFCYEIGPHGFRCDWGRVTVFEPPQRLVFSWQIGPHREPVPDPARASEVEVLFTTAVDGTTVTLEHRHFDRHGRAADTYRDQLDSAQGWPYLLDCYRKAV